MNEASLDPRSEAAVKLALSAQWKEAVELNLKLLENYPEDVDTLNRLGRAYTELGNITKAKQCYQKVLKIDTYNSIANNNLKRLSNIRASDLKSTSQNTLDPKIFLEDPGKTKVIELTDLALPSLLATQRTGDDVKLTNTKTEVAVVTQSGKRLGKLQKEWGEVVAEAMAAGSHFSAVIKAVSIQKDPSVTVFVRETKRGSKISQSVFPSESNNFTPFVREEVLSLLANQDPVQTEGDGTIEEVEIKNLPTSDRETFGDLGAKDTSPEPIFEDEED